MQEKNASKMIKAHTLPNKLSKDSEPFIVSQTLEEKPVLVVSLAALPRPLYWTQDTAPHKMSWNSFTGGGARTGSGEGSISPNCSWALQWDTIPGMAQRLRNPSKHRALLKGLASCTKGQTHTKVAGPLPPNCRALWQVQTSLTGATFPNSPTFQTKPTLPTFLFYQSNSSEEHCNPGVERPCWMEESPAFSTAFPNLTCEAKGLAMPPVSLGHLLPPAWLPLSLGAADTHMEADRGPSKQDVSEPLGSHSARGRTAELWLANWSPMSGHLWACLFTALALTQPGLDVNVPIP